MTTELCTYTRNACDIARRTGVERIELCAAPLEGGTTPSAGLIRYARSLPGLRLSVMIRPRGGDFLYTDDEVALMAEEIRLAREYGADGVVFGLLTPAGEVDETRTAQLVRDDIVVFAAGNQIYADAVVAQDSCYVNEALITGESDEIKKNPGDKLLSGSFVVSGMCRAQLTDVGADSYVSRLTQEAKRAKKPQQSEMMRALQNLVKWIGILVIPLGVVMFVKEYVWLGRLRDAWFDGHH